LRDCAAGAAGIAAAAFVERVRAAPPNETIQVGCIGTGGQCRRLMQRLAKIDGVRLAAVCDVWDEHLRLAREIAGPQAATTKEYREVLDRRDIDAVVIGTPDHWHAPMTIAACQAGKDVYVEKPLTHDLAEGPTVIETVKKSQRIVQVGTQQRSMPQYLKGGELIRGGHLGKVHKVHLTWNRNYHRWKAPQQKIDPGSVDWRRFVGPARQQPFDPFRFRNWRWFWDFGGGMLTDLMVHWIDVAYWYFDLDLPETAAAVGDHFMFRNVWETPDTMHAVLRYPKQQLLVHFEGTFVNARQDAMVEFLGGDATLYLDRGRYEVIPERGSKTPASELVLGKGEKGQSYYQEVDGPKLHLQNWVDCLRSRATPNAPVEAAVRSAAAAHWANKAYRAGAVVRPEK
jgi:predicted dehydrogenase